MTESLNDPESDVVKAQMATRLMMDTLKSVNWLKMKRINIRVHRNRKRAGRGKRNIGQTQVLGIETITITISVGPGGLSKQADGLMGNWDKHSLLNVYNAVVGNSQIPADDEDGYTDTEGV